MFLLIHSREFWQMQPVVCLAACKAYGHLLPSLCTSLQLCLARTSHSCVHSSVHVKHIEHCLQVCFAKTGHSWLHCSVHVKPPLQCVIQLCCSCVYHKWEDLLQSNVHGNDEAMPGEYLLWQLLWRHQKSRSSCNVKSRVPCCHRVYDMLLLGILLIIRL